MNILDIFYNYVIKEAATGKISCFLNYRILFYTYIVEDNIRIDNDLKIDDVIIPTLIINNKSKFNFLLQEYVNICLDFYSDENYRKEIIDRVDYDENRTCKEKFILLHLWSNATFEDFQNPEEFLRKKINYFKNNLDNISFTSEYSQIINGNINFSIKNNNIYNETPYKISINCTNGEETYNFPDISFSICDDIVYIYAIQNSSRLYNQYAKRVNRSLFKVNEDFDEKIDNYDIYKEGNLKDISVSFLIALNMAVSYFNKLGYKKIIVPNMLLVRWNSKKIILYDKYNKGIISKEEKEAIYKEQAIIQKNLSEKFLRTFLRLSYHYDNISITSYPFDADSNLHLIINGELKTSNKLLQEIANLVSNQNINHKL